MMGMPPAPPTTPTGGTPSPLTGELPEVKPSSAELECRPFRSSAPLIRVVHLNHTRSMSTKPEVGKVAIP